MMLEKNRNLIRKREPSQQRGRDSKAKLKTAARIMINNEGFDQITAYKVSAAAGISVGTFYAYFLDKDDIFASIVEDYAKQQYETFCRDAQAVLQGYLNFEEALTELLKRFFEMHQKEPRLHEEIVIQSLKKPVILAVLEKNDQRIVGQLLAFLSHYVKISSWNPEDVYLIKTTFKSNIHDIIFTSTNLPVDQLLTKLSRMIYLFIEDIKSR